VAFTRGLYPKNIDLAVDMHGRYDAGTAKRVAKELEPFKLMWLEEPVPPENIDAMRDVRASTSTPICCGENIFLRHGFREIFEKRAVDIIMPDFQKCGGLLEARKIADMAHTYYIPVAPHAVTSPIGMMATAQVAAAIPNFLVQEWHWVDSPALWKNWVKEGEIIEKGFITLPDRAGIGVEMNDDGARKAQVPNTPWFDADGHPGGGLGRHQAGRLRPPVRRQLGHHHPSRKSAGGPRADRAVAARPSRYPPRDRRAGEERRAHRGPECVAGGHAPARRCLRLRSFRLEGGWPLHRR
jgi:hypothetical protein